MIPNNELPARLTLQTYNHKCAAEKMYYLELCDVSSV